MTAHTDGAHVNEDKPDAPRRFRFEYRARVPRHLVGAALAEAIGALRREMPEEDADPPPTTAPPTPPRTACVPPCS